MEETNQNQQTDNQLPKKLRKMKKWIKFLAIPLAVLLVLAVLAGFLISAITNPNQYKPEIEKVFKEKTGYKLQITGDVGISLLPVPKAYIENTVISNGSRQLVEVEQINVYPQIIPLLRGEKKISSILVKAPQVTLEKSQTGNNWERKDWIAPEDDGKKSDITIENIDIEDGRFEYADRISGKSQVLDKLNVNASLAGLEGPLNLKGSTIYNGAALEIKSSVKDFTDPQIFLDLKEENTTLKFEGKKTGGKVILSSKDISSLLTAAGSNIPQLAAKNLKFDGNAKYENNIIQLSNAKFSFGQTNGSGSMAVQLSDNIIAANVAVGLDKLNLDELMATAAKKGSAASDAGSKNKSTAKIKAEIALKAAQLIYKAAEYKNLNLTATIDGDNIALRPFAIQTPGQGNVETYGILSKNSRGWDYDGTLTSNAKDLRGLLYAFGTKLDKVNPKGLKSYDVQGKITVSTGEVNKINLSEMKLKLDQSNIDGSFSVLTQKPPKVFFKGSVDKINIDNYANPAPADAGTSGAIKGNKKLDFGWLKNLPVEAELGANIGQIIYSGKTHSNIHVIGNIKPNYIDFKEISGVFNNFSVGALLNLNVAGARPQFNVNANMDVVKLADVTKTKSGAAAKTSGGGKWSEEVFNFSPLDQLDGNFNAKVNSIIGDKITFSNVSLNGKLNGGTAILEKFYANVFDGSIQLDGQLNISAVPSIKVNLSADNINVGKAANGLVTNWPISGQTSVNGNFTSAGVHQKAMIDNLNGNAAINATNISVRGLDLASYAYNVANLNDPLAVVTLLKSVSGGNKTTQMNSVGSIYAEKGVLSTQGLNLKSDSANGFIKGSLDLPKWYMDSDATFNLAVSDAKKTPSFGVHLFGPPDALKKEYDTKDLEKYTAEKGLISEKTQQLLKPSGLENKLNEKLMKKLGVKPPVEAAPAPAPAEPAPAEGAVQPAPEAAPAQQPKQDIKQEMLNQGLKQLFGN